MLFEILYNVKKYEKHTINDALHFILKKVGEYKRKHGKVDFFYIRRYQRKFNL